MEALRQIDAHGKVGKTTLFLLFVGGSLDDLSKRAIQSAKINLHASWCVHSWSITEYVGVVSYWSLVLTLFAGSERTSKPKIP